MKCMFRGHSTEDFISLPSSGSSEVLSALISLPPEALPREERRVREIAGVLPHHPRNIDCLITVALQPIINTTGWWRWRRRSGGGGGGTALCLKGVMGCLKCINSSIHLGFLSDAHTRAERFDHMQQKQKSFCTIVSYDIMMRGSRSPQICSAQCNSPFK